MSEPAKKSWLDVVLPAIVSIALFYVAHLLLPSPKTSEQFSMSWVMAWESYALIFLIVTLGYIKLRAGTKEDHAPTPWNGFAYFIIIILAISVSTGCAYVAKTYIFPESKNSSGTKKSEGKDSPDKEKRITRPQVRSAAVQFRRGSSSPL